MGRSDLAKFTRFSCDANCILANKEMFGRDGGGAPVWIPALRRTQRARPNISPDPLKKSSTLSGQCALYLTNESPAKLIAREPVDNWDECASFAKHRQKHRSGQPEITHWYQI